MRHFYFVALHLRRLTVSAIRRAAIVCQVIRRLADLVSVVCLLLQTSTLIQWHYLQFGRVECQSSRVLVSGWPRILIRRHLGYLNRWKTRIPSSHIPWLEVVRFEWSSVTRFESSPQYTISCAYAHTLMFHTICQHCPLLCLVDTGW